MVLEKNLQNGKAGGCAFLDYFSVKYYESNENHYIVLILCALYSYIVLITDDWRRGRSTVFYLFLHSIFISISKFLVWIIQ